MLEEAIEVLRLLWRGGMRSHHGRHYTVENARLYTLPDEPPPIIVSAFGPKATALAARVGDGLWGTAPKPQPLREFRQAAGDDKPAYGPVKVCWAEDEASARRTVLERWSNGGIPGRLARELGSPAGRTQSGTWRRSTASSKRATTTSTCSRSVPSRKGSSASTSVRYFPSSADRAS